MSQATADLTYLFALCSHKYSGLENKNIGVNYYAEDLGIWEDNIENETGNSNEVAGLRGSQ